jgi:hypothetical protein
MRNKSDDYGAYVQKVRNDTNRWLAQLKGDNENMRRQVAALESERNRLQQEKLRLLEQLVSVREELSTHLEDHTTLIRRLTEAELANQRTAEQFCSVEAQNANLANLYVASYQLHGSLDRSRVLSAIKEIIVNLIGSEEFAVYERRGDALALIDWFGEKPTAYESVRPGDGIIGRVAATGEAFIASEHERSAGITACVPLRVDGVVTGAIAVFRLLPQKDGMFESLDHELLDLLASQAGIALFSSGLRSGKAAVVEGGAR